jgi:hypothetical protein
MGNLANTNMPDTSTKLSVDVKQELTIDPRTVGLGSTDEMTIASIACRESYLTQFPWLVATAPETPLFEINVTPMVWDTYDDGSGNEIHLPACGFAAIPFENWKGTMKYRFQVVASAYHKGRLKVVYEPNGFASNEYNTNYTRIIDIAQEKDFTVDVGWAQPYPYGSVSQPGTNRSVTSLVFKQTGFTDQDPSPSANGVLRVYVVNELAVPGDPALSPVTVNVFVSAHDDIQFRNPTSTLNDFSYFPTGGFSTLGVTPQSGVEQPDAENTWEDEKPMEQSVSYSFNTPLDETDNSDKVFFGESIVSFRALLKRYNRLAYVSESSFSPMTLFTLETNAFPYYKGYAPGAIYTTDGGEYSYGMMTLMNYLTPAYCGWRGGIRWKSSPTLSNTSAQTYSATVIRGSEEVALWSQDKVTLPGGNSGLSRLSINDNATHSGAVATSSSVNPVLEWELPFSVPRRFVPAKTANVTANADGRVPYATNQELSYIVSGDTNTFMFLDLHIAAAEDFSLFFFTGAPRLYYGVNIPSG